MTDRVTHRTSVHGAWFFGGWKVKCSVCGTVARTDISRTEARILAAMHSQTGRK